jgi:hypothetical protein
LVIESSFAFGRPIAFSWAAPHLLLTNPFDYYISMPPPSATHHKGNHKGGGKPVSDAAAAPAPDVSMEAVAATSSSTPSSSDMQAMFDKFALSFDARLGSLETNLSRDLGTMSTSLDGAMTKMADRMDAHELHSKTHFDVLDAQIMALEARFAAAPVGALPSPSSQPILRPAPAPATSSKPADDCIVFVRGFPVLLPSFAMKEYITEALSVIPALERGRVRTRSSAADDQFSLVFPSPAQADSFIDAYRAGAFVFIDPADESKEETPLKVSKSKPLAQRRLGKAIHPVYEQLEVIIDAMPTLRGASITQRQAPRNGIWSTEFFAQTGRVLTPLFTLRFREDPTVTVITEVVAPPNGSALSAAHLQLIRDATVIQ